MGKIITLYNNKGGVSKTTTSFNFAAYLEKHERKKVLIIDADSQSNITELFFAADPDFWDSTSEALPGDSIFGALKPRLEGNTSRINPNDIKLCKHLIYENLYLLRGDINFSALAEGYFSSSIEQAITSQIHQKNTYLSIRRLTRDLIKTHKFDYVVIDLGPSTGAISRLCLLACDQYFVPITPDRFSALAVRSLPRVLLEWFNHDKLVLSTFSPYGIESDYSPPVFCGAINQQFQVHRGKIKKSYEKWADKIKTNLKEQFMSNAALPASSHLKSNPFISQIENLGPIAPVAQILGKAIFDITQEDTRFASSSGQMYYGAVFEPWQEKISMYQKEMAKLFKATK